MKLSEEQKLELLAKGSQALFCAHNERETYYNIGVKEKIIRYLCKDIEVLIPIIEEIIKP